MGSSRSARQLVIQPDDAIRKTSVSYLILKVPLHTGDLQHKQENGFCPMVCPSFQAPLLPTTPRPIWAAEAGRDIPRLHIQEDYSLWGAVTWPPKYPGTSLQTDTKTVEGHISSFIDTKSHEAFVLLLVWALHIVLTSVIILVSPNS